MSSSQHEVDTTNGVGLTGNSNTEVEGLGRGHRNKQPSVRLKDHVLYAIQNLSPSASSSIQTHPPGKPYLIANFVSCDKFSVRHKIVLAAITAGT